MADIAQVGLFVLACASLSGLTVFLFRDQIMSRDVLQMKDQA